MNAPHPIRALHGHLLTVAPSLDALPAADPATAYNRAHADGELDATMSMLEQAVASLTTGAWHLDRAVRKDAGNDLDRAMLERLQSRLAAAVLSVEASTGHLSNKLAGAR